MERKSFATFCIASICCLCLVFSAVSTPIIAANIEETDDEIRVTIGARDTMSPAALTKYSNAQASSLAQFIDETPNAVGKALVTFDRFLTVEQAASILEGTEKIDTIYMWMPNQEGRAIIYVQNNDIETSIREFFRSIGLSTQPASEMKSSLLDLEKNYGIFAVKIDDQYTQLQSMEANEVVSHMDLLYSSEAVQLANSTGKTVKYICVPEKPDGTL